MPLAQPAPITTIPVEVDFARQLQPWYGFGFNYYDPPSGGTTTFIAVR